MKRRAGPPNGVSNPYYYEREGKFGVKIHGSEKLKASWAYKCVGPFCRWAAVDWTKRSAARWPSLLCRSSVKARE